MTHVEHNIAFNGLEREVWEVRSVLKQKQRELGHSSTKYVILNPHVPLWASHLYYPFQSCQMCILGQPSEPIVILNQIVLQLLGN